MAQHSVIRPGEALEPYDYSILLLGARGNGKSTFVNTLVNVIIGSNPGNLQAAAACDKYPNIIPALDDGLQERNDFKTIHAHFYKLKSSITDNKTILVIDTPGLASNGGISEDDDNVQIIINAARRIKFLNAIIVVEKSSTNRLSPLVEYNLCRISEIIPQDFQSQVIVAYTFNLGFILFMDNWFPFPIQYKLKINNGAFRYSSKEYQANPKYINKSDWDRSVNKIKKFITKLLTMQKVPTIQYTNLFDHHSTMMNKIADFKGFIDNIEKYKNFIKNSKPGERLNAIKWIRTDYHNTVCLEHRTLCHEKCSLNFDDSHGTSFFNNCLCMNAQKICKVCGCNSENHAYKNEKPIIEISSIDQMLDSCSIGDRSSSENILKAFEAKEQKLILDLVEIESNISRISPNYRISMYLIKAIDYLRFQIEFMENSNKLGELQSTLTIYQRLARGIQTCYR
ncbi:hypothetical protein SteCoe_31733 [Stentor coeruleus]|uniref:Uncharacterized protein n=1 Tax=Stentor coeruleus TaxID=5963 RepID=A0A1R2B122_9CILI|nr:hypothetical protein SteCoe_31733 [Stentor coeruleus]